MYNIKKHWKQWKALASKNTWGINGDLLLFGSLQYFFAQTLIWHFKNPLITQWIFCITVRPRDARPQAARTSQVHLFELGPKNLRWTNLCSENLEQHDFLIILPSPYQVAKVARVFFSQKTCISRPYCRLKIEYERFVIIGETIIGIFF